MTSTDDRPKLSTLAPGLEAELGRDADDAVVPSVRSGRNRNNPTLWEAEQWDPTLEVPPASRAIQIRDQQRSTRRLLQPFAHVASMATIHGTFLAKWAVPVPLGSQRALNLLGPSIMRRFVAPEVLEVILRHLVIETNLINFVVRNSGADDVAEATLRPMSAADLGDDHGLNAIIRHDTQIFNVIIDLGQSDSADIRTARPLGDLDFSMLTIPDFDLDLGVRRWMALDLQTSLQFMVAGLALMMDRETAERAVNSFQYDASLFECLANITGDHIFRIWTPEKFSNWLGTSSNVGRDLHWHIIVTEYAHSYLCRLRDQRDGMVGSQRRDSAWQTGPSLDQRL